MNNLEYRMTENRITHACCYHVCWSPTFRRPVLTEPMRIRIKELIEEVCRRKRITILELDIRPNIIYLHADMPPMESVNCMVRNMKRVTASALRTEFPELRSRLPGLWTLHYFVSTKEEKPVEEMTEWFLSQPRYMPKKKREESTDENKLD